MRRAALGILLLLTACAETGARTAGTAAPGEMLLARAPTIGALVRAAPLCGRPLTMLAQDRAARLETAAIALHQQQGGLAARDEFLRGMEPPAFDPRRRGSDRAAWCSAREAEITRLDAMLSGEDGKALVRSAEAVMGEVR
ncbi:hypothetical protein GCM10011504_20580 [Siccirubricoccus deserti]|uniref:Uncharacterized protein n=1 Tax=Siccirubricoccus deserti TaxID=2013562 RepID=A0A9X0QWX6_9PROT|nr:hypothetical protein [Siccirubricoccus deserti]MBC4015479.1 hypothetical protein [Siccirubricoccus deserti]GGC42032.1 hypothetical protein GCM10011504_20580 [Siccirubricoccus deserti]